MEEYQEHSFQVQATLFEAADQLRNLADQLEKGLLSSTGTDMPLDPDSRVKLEMKVKKDKFSLKLKIKPPKNSDIIEVVSEVIEEQEPAMTGQPLEVIDVPEQEAVSVVSEDIPAKPKRKEKYSKLKERMEKDWKNIRKSAKQGTLPDDATVERFVEDSAAMITYTDKGEEYYDNYRENIDRMSAAFEKRNAAEFIAVLDDISKVRKAAHQKYK